MTLDDLEKEFWGDQREQTTRVRLARVVRAMRGVIDQAYSEGRASKVRGDNENVQRRWVDAMINEILGGDAEEAAGGPARKDGKAVEAAGDKGPVTVNSPAADLVIVDDAGNFTEEQWEYLHSSAVSAEDLAIFGMSASRMDSEGNVTRIDPADMYKVLAAAPITTEDWLSLAKGTAFEAHASVGETKGFVFTETAPAAAPAAQSPLAKSYEAEMRAVAPAADVCTWSHPKPGPIGQLVEYERSTCGNPKWAEGYPKWVDGYFESKCQCGRPIYVDQQDPANAWLFELL